ncbi:SAP domain-containing ribonucleoprotein [Topomyia yanbarensis]|uniref:SAP domain-containing ribonucleoprotein n=1 Tax=Topomyia yanbarensis TaxID=2498891 RepID=UPI00273AEF6C|nr:SAP domain-containing ribonucleoprotein [Topomyia yanbarensis]XP_058823121.1 SAP domain-containing ribonucleoprotein [Topomyia yanbarensis]
MSENDISKMKVADLKKELKNRGLNTLGNKNELVERLQNALIDGGDPLEDTANSEDLLEDDELNDDILEEEEEKLQDGIVEEDRMLKSPTPSEASKSESPEQKAQEQCNKNQEPQEEKKEEQAMPQKKVALKRNISISVPTLVTTPVAVTSVASDGEAKKTEDANKSEQHSGEPEKKIIKLNQMTAQERLEMRAKKFGAQVVESPNSKLQARAARFGLGGTSSSVASGSPTSNLISLDALKKRAERFGVNVSDKVTKLELDEKLQKRQARFGEAATTSKLTATGKVAITAASSTNTNYSERARLRLERFKNTA